MKTVVLNENFLVEQVLLRFPVASDGRFVYIKKEKEEKTSNIGMKSGNSFSF